MHGGTEITGMPYFPGVAAGRLHKGRAAVRPGCILLVSQQEVIDLPVVPAAFIVVEAAPFSHTMIGLLGLGVPTVLVNAQQAARLEEGVELRVDGSSGMITTERERQFPSTEVSQPTAGQALLTADGMAVSLRASVRHAAAARDAVRAGAAAIGLVRTEFLSPGQDRVPGAPFYRQAFADVCEAARPLAVTFRLLDVAADKVPPWLTGNSDVGGALGRQGVRLYGLTGVKPIIDAQLEAVGALAETFELGVLIPYLVRYEELMHWLTVIRSRLPVPVPVGAMAETPAGVLDIAHWLETADFVAVGCNDLMQCLFAADRDQPALRRYLDPYAPLLYRFLRQVAEQAGAHQDRLQLCGLLSQLQGVLPVLLGLGYRVFSVDAPFIPHLAKTVERVTVAQCEALAEQVCRARRTREVLEILGLPVDRHSPYWGSDAETDAGPRDPR
jgi:phosphoenolpyruvate-protein kinase (PTS system EI component)